MNNICNQFHKCIEPYDYPCLFEDGIKIRTIHGNRVVGCRSINHPYPIYISNMFIGKIPKKYIYLPTNYFYSIVNLKDFILRI